MDELRDSAYLVRKSFVAKKFIEYIIYLHKEIKEKLEKSTMKYKIYVNIDVGASWVNMLSCSFIFILPVVAEFNSLLSCSNF